MFCYMQNVAEDMVSDVGSFPSSQTVSSLLCISLSCPLSVKWKSFLHSSNMSVVVLMKNAYKDVEDLHFYVNHRAIEKLQ